MANQPVDPDHLTTGDDMTVTHHTVPGVADPGVPHISVATGSRTLYLAGCVGSLPDGSPAGDTLRAQAAQAFRNISTVLASQGASWADIAKTTVYVVDYTPEKLADIYGGVEDYVTGGGEMTGFSASTLVGVSALFEAWALVEIDVTAVVD
jgi:enamine deaminase RidA (YjgF/YER057c/UK114 family)